MGEARRETGMGLLKGRLVGQTLDLVLKLVVVSPFLSDACLAAFFLVAWTVESGMSFLFWTNM